MTSNEAMRIVGEAVQEIASLLNTSLSEFVVTVENPTTEAMNFHKGYSAALGDVSAIIARMATKLGATVE